MGNRIALHSESAYTSRFMPNLKRIRLGRSPKGLYSDGVPRHSNLASELPDKNIFHHLHEFRLKSFEGIGRLDTLASPRPHFTGARRISQERFERAREERGVTMRHEYTG